MKLSIQTFPNSINNPFIITSDPVPDYNCIAWVYGINNTRMWPLTQNFYWPNNITNDHNLSSFIELFKSISYDICDDGSLELGYEKISIFEKEGKVTHASKQLSDGLWSSKLGHRSGISYDVSHTIQSISGGVYGDVSIYMKRKINKT